MGGIPLGMITVRHHVEPKLQYMRGHAYPQQADGVSRPGVMNKIAKVTLFFWIMKIYAITVGKQPEISVR